uniref:protein NATD1-like isoform X1 n=1 Tax=Myxine glutinosa TaxID=7769 RepID=UPI00358E4353
MFSLSSWNLCRRFVGLVPKRLVGHIVHHSSGPFQHKQEIVTPLKTTMECERRGEAGGPNVQPVDRAHHVTSLPDVHHDRQNGRFFIRLEGSSDPAVLLYDHIGERTINLHHTEVPKSFRNQGLAKHLTMAALDFMVEEDLKAKVTCSYIQKYIKAHPLPQYMEKLQDYHSWF